MNRIKWLIGMLMVCGVAHADRWDAAVSRNAGNSAASYSTTVSTSAATKIVDGSIGVQSATIDIFNNSAYTIWVGTNTTSLVTTGFPILSSTTYTTDGTYTGDLYGTADSGAGSGANLRSIYYLKNDALR